MPNPKSEYTMNIYEINYISKTKPVVTKGRMSITYPNYIDSAGIPSAPKPHPSCQIKPPSSCPRLGSWTFCSSLYQSQRTFCLKLQAHLQSTSDAHLLYSEPTSHLKGGIVVPLLQDPGPRHPRASGVHFSSTPRLTFPRLHPWPRMDFVLAEGQEAHSLTRNLPFPQGMARTSQVK